MTVTVLQVRARRRWVDGGPVDGSPLPGAMWPLHLVSHLEDHLIWMQLKGRAARTLFCRRRALVLLAYFLDADPAHATATQLGAWQVHLLKVSTNNVAWYTGLIRPYYRWLHQSGHRGDDPAALLPTPRLPPRLPRPIAEQRLLDAVRTAPAWLLPYLLLAGWSGMRAAEIASLAVEDVLHDDGQIWWRVHGKGGRWRDVPVPAWVWLEIAEGLPASGPAWRRQRGTGRVTAKHVSSNCNRFLRDAEIADTLHAFRHRAATLLYRQRRDIRLVQAFLGHADPATTAVYTRVAPEDLVEAVAALPAAELPTHRRHLRAVPRARRVAR